MFQVVEEAWRTGVTIPPNGGPFCHAPEHRTQSACYHIRHVLTAIRDEAARLRPARPAPAFDMSILDNE